MSGLTEQNIVSTNSALPQGKKTGTGRGNLRGGGPVSRDLRVTWCREGGVRSGEDEAQGDEERHNPNAEEDYGGAIVLAEETRYGHFGIVVVLCSSLQRYRDREG